MKHDSDLRVFLQKSARQIIAKKSRERLGSNQSNYTAGCGTTFGPRWSFLGALLVEQGDNNV